MTEEPVEFSSTISKESTVARTMASDVSNLWNALRLSLPGRSRRYLGIPIFVSLAILLLYLVPNFRLLFLSGEPRSTPCDKVTPVKDVGTIGWSKVDLNGVEAPKGLESLAAQLHGHEEPLPAHPKKDVSDRRKENGYSRFDADRIVFHTGRLPAGHFPLKIVIPDGLNVRIFLYRVLHDGSGSRLAEKPDAFYRRGEDIPGTDMGDGTIDVVAFVYPLDRCAYEYFNENGFRLLTIQH